MAMNVTQKLIQSHLRSGEMKAGEEIAVSIDQTLTQDATGTLVMLALEAIDLDRAATELSVQYIDHNLLQLDSKNAEDHLFLRSACERFGIWLSPAGNGVSHPVHMQHFGKPGKTLAGSDSHTPAAGAIGMLAIGAGGLDVAMAMAGEPLRFKMPEIWGVKLVGRLPPWVSAKDVILEMLRRHDVNGGINRILEYFGPGLAELSVMDRHVIANMGTELGATTTIFPSDGTTRAFLEREGRQEDWSELCADAAADYDIEEELDLSQLEPLIAKPSSPGNVVPVREVAGGRIYQAYIGSSANPGYRDFAMAARMVAQQPLHPGVSFDINPTSRRMLEALAHHGYLELLIKAGARITNADAMAALAWARRRLPAKTVFERCPEISRVARERGKMRFFCAVLRPPRPAPSAAQSLIRAIWGWLVPPSPHHPSGHQRRPRALSGLCRKSKRGLSA